MRATIGVTALAAATLAGQDLPPTKAIPPASTHAAHGVQYLDVTADAGLASFHHVSGSPDKNYVIEVTGSGVAALDYDGDGLQDVYLVNGSTLERVRQNAAAPPAALYRNLGGGRFRDVTAEAGVANERWGQGVCAGDFDNDGDEDLYVTNFGVNRLYRNEGGRCLFYYYMSTDYLPPPWRLLVAGPAKRRGRP